MNYLYSMKKYLALMLILVFFSLFSSKAEASHIPGANISATCDPANPLTYHFTLTVFVKCPRVLPSSISRFTLTNSCGLPIPIVPVFRQVGSRVDINQLCPTAGSICSGGSQPSAWKYTYEGTIILPADCDGWNLKYEECCRDNSTNIVNNSNSPIVCNTIINTLTAPCNNTPVITSQPIPYACVNTPISYCLTTSDAEGDSVAYRMVSPVGFSNAALTHQAGFSVNAPLSNFVLNPLTGCFTFNQPTPGNFVVAIQIEEYDRLGNLKSSIVHDFQILVINCNNIPPFNPMSITNVTGNATQNGMNRIDVCLGQSFCFDVAFTDANAGDILTILTNGTTLFPGATFTQTGTNPITGTFCWTATTGNTGTIATFIAEDDACPVKGVTSYGVRINVKRGASANPTNSGMICNGSGKQLTTTGAVGTTYAWYRDRTMTQQFSTMANPTVSNITNDSTFYLVATDASGCAATLDSTTVVLFPLGAAPNISPSTSVCPGGTVSLSTTTISNIYDWTGPNGFSSNIQNPAPITSISNVDTGTYSLKIEDTNGCMSASATTILSVFTPPSAPVLTVNSPLCQGTDLVLTTSSVGTSYSWTAPNGAITTTNTPTLTITPANSLYLSGNWLVSVIDVNGCSSATSIAASVTINAVPALAGASNNSPVCYGASAQLSANTLVGAFYNWYSDAAGTMLVSTAQNPIINNLTSTSTYYLKVTVNGCSSPLEATTVMVHAVTVAPNVPANFSVCENASISLSTTTNANTYSWTGPNGFASSSKIPATITSASTLNAGTYSLVVQDFNGCTSPSSNVLVRVNSLPARPSLTSNSAICQGDDLVFTATSSFVSRYIWTAPNGSDTITSTSNVFIPSTSSLHQAGNWTLAVQYRGINGCTSPSSLPTSVLINSRPALAGASNNGPVCYGASAQLSANTIVGASYNWYSDAAGTMLVSTAQNPIINNLTSTSTYYLKVTVNGCSSPLEATTVMVHAVAVAPNVPANFTVCEGQNIAMMTTTLASSYSWTGPNGFSSSLQNPSVIQAATMANAGLYLLNVTYPNGCQSASSGVVVTVNSNPMQPVIATNSPLCFGDTLVLRSSANCSQTQWIGPNGNSQATLGTVGGGNVLWTYGSRTMIPSTNANYLSGNWTMICIDSLTGCRAESAPIRVEIKTVPVVTATNNSPICNGASAQLTASAIAGATYQWYSDAAMTNLVATNRVVNLNNRTASATYYVVATVNGCTSLPASTSVMVNPILTAPVPTYSALCQFDSLFLQANATGSIVAYNWTGPNGFVSNLANPKIPNAQTFNGGTYTLQVTDTLGCQAMGAIQVVIRAKPQTPTITNNAPFCAGANTLVLNTQTYTGANVSYFWTLPNGSTPTTLVPSLRIPNATVADTGLYTLVVYVDGCLSLSADTYVRINPIPTAPVLPANMTVCENNAIVLSTPTMAHTYSWTGPNGFTSNLQNPIAISAASVLDAGTYSLVIGDINACQSMASTVNITVNPVPTRPFITSNNTPICTGGTIVLAADTMAGATYQWYRTATNTIVGTGQNLTIVAATMADTGHYHVVRTLNGCQSVASASTTVHLNTSPIDHAYAGQNIMLCNQNTANLAAMASPFGTGLWTAISSTATIINPAAAATVLVNIPTGTSYYVWTLSNGTCPNYSSDTLMVVVATTTDTAEAGINQLICSNTTNLSARLPSVGTGYWTQTSSQAAQGVIIANPTSPSTAVLGMNAGNSYAFTWSLSNGPCVDYSSDITIITVNSISSDNAYAGTDINICGNTTTTNLAAAIPTLATGIWTTNSTAIISNPTRPNTTISNLALGQNIFVWTLSSGSCINYDTDTMLVIVTPTFSIDTANAGLDIDICNADTAHLIALTPTVATGRWTQPLNQSSAGVIIANINNPNTVIRGLELDSTYKFTWSVSNGPCADYDTDEITVQVSSLPADAAYAGLDVVICGIDEAILTATTPSAGTGFWTTSSSATIVTPPHMRTEIVNMPLGVNQFVWTLSNGACHDYSSDTVQITVDNAPVANADSFVVVYNSTGNTIDVIPNDNLNNNWTISIVEQMNSGTLTNSGTGEFNLVLQDILVNQSFIYKLCNPNCPDIYCDTALVLIDVQGGTICNFPNTITPNGDGVNDNFVIPCLDGRIATKLQVFSRWGDLIYQDDNYLNNWQGTHNGQPVPDATYFYIMELSDGTKYQGFVEVRR